MKTILKGGPADGINIELPEHFTVEVPAIQTQEIYPSGRRHYGSVFIVSVSWSGAVDSRAGFGGADLVRGGLHFGAALFRGCGFRHDAHSLDLVRCQCGKI